MLARWLGDVFADRVARGTWILLFLLVGLVGTLFMHRAQVLAGFDLVPFGPSWFIMCAVGLSVFLCFTWLGPFFP